MTFVPKRDAKTLVENLFGFVQNLIGLLQMSRRVEGVGLVLVGIILPFAGFPLKLAVGVGLFVAGARRLAS